jgi:hypothetical protein
MLRVLHPDVSLTWSPFSRLFLDPPIDIDLTGRQYRFILKFKRNQNAWETIRLPDNRTDLYLLRIGDLLLDRDCSDMSVWFLREQQVSTSVFVILHSDNHYSFLWRTSWHCYGWAGLGSKTTKSSQNSLSSTNHQHAIWLLLLQHSFFLFWSKPFTTLCTL